MKSWSWIYTCCQTPDDPNIDPYEVKFRQLHWWLDGEVSFLLGLPMSRLPVSTYQGRSLLD